MEPKAIAELKEEFKTNEVVMNGWRHHLGQLFASLPREVLELAHEHMSRPTDEVAKNKFYAALRREKAITTYTTIMENVDKSQREYHEMAAALVKRMVEEGALEP